jgi:hypothetical protein
LRRRYRVDAEEDPAEPETESSQEA